MGAVTVATLQNLLAANRVMEAKALLISGEAASSNEELRGYALKIEQRLAQAKALLAQAASMEHGGKIEEAKVLYESVLFLAADYPGIEERLNRMNEALLLTRAVQRRNERFRHAQPTAAGKGGRWVRAVWMGMMGTGLAAAALLLMLVQLQSPLPETRIKAAPAPAGVQQAEPEPVRPLAQDNPQAPLPTKQIKAAPPAPASDPQTVPAPPTSPVPDKPAPSVPAESRAPVTASEEPQPPPAASGPHPLHTPAVNDQAPAGSQPPPPVAVSDQPTDLFYIVRPHDSLIAIARNRLCNEAAWQQIYQLNRNQIAHPDKVLPGMVLRLTGLENQCPQSHRPSSQADGRTSVNEGSEEKVNR